MSEILGGINTDGSAALGIHSTGSLVWAGRQDPSVPEIGTPAFRAFVETPEWMEMRHEEALADNQAWEDAQEHERIMASIPTKVLGVEWPDPRLWGRDWRERLPVDDALRMDYEEEIYGKTEAEIAAADPARLSILHGASMLLTEVVR